MDRRRLTGLIALVFAIIVVAGITYYDAVQNRSDGPESFPPAMSADESTPGDETIKPPANLVGDAKEEAGATTADASPPAGDAKPDAAAPGPATETALAAPADAAKAGAPAETAMAPAAKDASPAPAADGAAPAPAATTTADATPSASDAAPAAGAAASDAAKLADTTTAPATGAPAADSAAPATTTADAAPPAAGAVGTEPATKPAEELADAPAAEESAVETAAAGSAPGTSAAAPAPQTAAAEKLAMAEPPAGAAAPDSATQAPMAVIPTFDVVRVEPTGDTVIAGLAAPGATVEILDSMEAIAKSEANDRGEWALVLDEALGPGTHDLAVRTTTDDGAVSTLSDQRVAVSVPEPGSKDVLVVLNAPDGPSKLLQVPPGMSKEAAPATGTDVAAAPGAATSGSAAAGSEAPAKDVAAAPGATASGGATGDAAKTGEAVAAAEPPAAAGTSGEPAKDSGPAMAAAEPPRTGAPATGTAGEPAPPAVAAAEPPAEPAKPAPEVVVAAVEADTAGMLYIAGTATTPEPVRVYLDEDVLGEAKPSPSGTWLVEVHREVAPGDYQVRADQIDSADGSVIARAAVPFEREIEVATLNASGSAGAGTVPAVVKTGDQPEVRTVIIKRGDNLWRIARSAWGAGFRWSNVYQANKDQIRNPHWIYPGQVFVMPILKDAPAEQ